MCVLVLHVRSCFFLAPSQDLLVPIFTNTIPIPTLPVWSVLSNPLRVDCNRGCGRASFLLVKFPEDTVLPLVDTSVHTPPPGELEVMTTLEMTREELSREARGGGFKELKWTTAVLLVRGVCLTAL